MNQNLLTTTTNAINIKKNFHFGNYNYNYKNKNENKNEIRRSLTFFMKSKEDLNTFEEDLNIQNINTDTNNDDKIMVFGLNLKDPQDLITIGLSTLIIYNTADLAVFYFNKLFNGQG